MDSYISPLIIDYLTKAHIFTKKHFVSEDDIIRNVSSSVSIVSLKENFAIPSQNKKLYTELVNKYCGIIMIVLDDLVNANYLIRQVKMCGIFSLKSYSLNFDSEFIKKVIKSDDNAYKYISHPAYSLKRGLPNNDDDLCNSIHSLTLEDNDELDKQPKKKVCYENQKAKNEENVETTNVQTENVENKIIKIMSIQSDSNVNKYYNMYEFKNGTKHCTCPHFQFVCKKQNILCKHLICAQESFPSYIRDKNVFSGVPVILTNHILKKYIKSFSQNIENVKDYELSTSSTIFDGRYIWAFEDDENPSLLSTNISNTTSNNELVDSHTGTFDGLSDNE